jgi:hypothetical protein
MLGAVVGFPDGELLKIMSEVMSGTRVCIPRWINRIRIPTVYMFDVGNNSTSTHCYVLLSIAPIIANTQKISVKHLETLGCGVARGCHRVDI